MFGSLLIWAARSQSAATVAAALICLVAGAVISYAKARAEGWGMTCNVGIAERTERLMLALFAALLAGLGVPYVLPAALWILAALSVLTVWQRMAVVYRQAKVIAAGERPGRPAARGGRSPDAESSGIPQLRRLLGRLAHAALDAGTGGLPHLSGLADQLWRRARQGRQQLERNLARVTGSTNQRTLRALSREGMQSYFRYWCDVFRLPDWSRQRLVDTFVMENNHRLQQVLDAGTGAVVALPHAGNWDRAGAYMTVAMTPIVSVAENPRRAADHQVPRLPPRAGHGHHRVPQGEDVFGDLVTKIGQGKIVALLGDRDLTSRGVGVDFFGEPTRMPAGPAALAIETGCR